MEDLTRKVCKENQRLKIFIRDQEKQSFNLEKHMGEFEKVTLVNILR